MPEPRQHAENRNAFERLLKKIPGFRGYLEKEIRRESDALQREWLADRLQRAKRGLDAASRDLADAGKIDVLPQFDRIRARVDKSIGRTRGAMQGYSGIFDLVRVDEKLLERVYEHDVAMMAHVETLADSVEKLPAQVNAGAAEALAALVAQLDEVERALDRREDLLKGLE